MKSRKNLADAYKTWEDHKSIRTLINLYNNSFTGGNNIWKMYRFTTGMIVGRYKKFYEAWNKDN